MNPRFMQAAEALQKLQSFSAVIDVRSPSEFALDHMPGAQNWPVLSDAERAEVGTLYTQVDPFLANKRGAVLVARNIANHIEAHAADLPKSWAPLIYCWRGGNRSGAMAHILARIGFSVVVVQGGYRALRRALRADLEKLPGRLQFHVICGRTGCGKSRLLQSLHEAGAQVLDLEALAQHRGSVLGLEPGETQPSQKGFETRLWAALRHFETDRPVFVEAESKKIGALHLPDALMESMRLGRCIALELQMPQRVALLLADYARLSADRPLLLQRLAGLRALRGGDAVMRWQEQIARGDLAAFTADILQHHYDPSYMRSIGRNFRHFETAPIITLESLDAGSFHEAASRVLALSAAATAPGSNAKTTGTQAQSEVIGG
ncbi:MAG: tRNA 2-selenouridine(34) synthase MnmH [Thiomonas sp.]|uniref:tRNA 2-selenouridine(34) synthase MnmH n=1 Tax=Thiomonas sp. TaxID=2047785 RepID=UPI002A35C2BF|nr:tRNA 2-selenouridine(34) synthase MnmH [Thiomonas sp.]MDY0330387.1 tRNA 2-selenouridine(34) synthase MnmH [Thiomonas sp.]